jgi:tyrosinase
LAANASIGALPYWSWPQGTRALFSPVSFGPDDNSANEDRVLARPFASWRALIFNAETQKLEPRSTPGLVRGLGRSHYTNLPSKRDFDAALSYGQYDAAPWGTSVDTFRSKLEV